DVAESARHVNEETRLKYRYLDLRNKRMAQNLVFRNNFVKYIRDFLTEQGFIEVETPMLTKTTMEGARCFLVPSRLHPGKFYALPMSPQQYKQLLMVGGVDKYFQIARCLRDEDQRGDRQPEFTQLDLEMSFIHRDDILNLVEELFTSAVEKLAPNKKIMKKPWPRLPYDEVIKKYGVDKPDLRYGLEIQEITELVKDCGFEVFTKAIKAGGVVRAINVPGAGEKLTRSAIDELTELAKKHKAKGLAYIFVEKDGSFRSPLTKFLGDDMTAKIAQAVKANKGDVIFFGADNRFVVEESLGQLRIELAKRLQLADPNVLAFAFVIDFPLFEENKMENGHYAPSHHMFTTPRPEDMHLLDTDPPKVKSWQYDFVCNGYEVGGGSIRIHDRDLQEKIFGMIGFKEEQREYFHHMLEAFEYGAPPHGGMAPGIDRLCMVIQGEPNIREVIAFPKTGDAEELLMRSPSAADPEHIKELHIKLDLPKTK
ncbi:aspartate--tRNA ligase, partial [Candidatus Uhrbacteria bacterium]|nr:aspartate--tRNA ligase [Candidatus Uhrbacteria bacterium]